MSPLTVIRYGALAATAGLVLALGAVSDIAAPPQPRVAAVGRHDIGGPFRLLDHTGAVVDSRARQGKSLVVIFGFTRCPDVCPTALTSLSQPMEDLGPDADRRQAVFIKVDPERDTREALARYGQAFDLRILAQAGTRQEVAAAAKADRVFAGKVPAASGDDTMNPAAPVFLTDAKGGFKGVITPDEPREAAMLKLRLLLGLRAA